MDSISDLSTFVEVVRAGSFVGAARKLRMTPSGVSKKVARFEQRLDTRLFNRTTRSLSLTEAGDLLFSRGTEILDDVDDAENLLKDLGDNPRGTLRIAASDAFAKEILIPFTQLFSERYRQLHIDIVPGDGEIDILDNRIDIAMRFSRPSISSFIARRLLDDPWVICASPAYIETFGEPRTPYELHQHRTLLIRSNRSDATRWQFRNQADAQSQSSRFEIPLEPSLTGIGLVVKEAALSGMGVARLARFLVHAELKKGALVSLLNDFTDDDERAIYFVYPNRQYLPLKVRLFIDELHDYVRTVLDREPAKTADD